MLARVFLSLHALHTLFSYSCEALFFKFYLIKIKLYFSWIGPCIIVWNQSTYELSLQSFIINIL